MYGNYEYGFVVEKNLNSGVLDSSEGMYNFEDDNLFDMNYEGTDVENIKQATEKLTTVFYEISAKLYQQANPNAGAEAQNDGNVYDADYKVEDEGNN